MILLSASLPILAAANEPADSLETCCPLVPPEPVESCQLPSGIFYPAQYPVGNCLNITFAGEFLYWEMNEDDTATIAVKQAGFFVGDPNTTVTTFDLLAHEQGYRPGFKVAGGIGLPCFDNWDIDMEYTWFHHRTTNTFRAPGQFEVFTSKFAPAQYNVFSSTLKSERRTNLNLLSATVGKSFYLSQRFIVKTGVGLKSWWATKHHNLFFSMVTNQLGTQFSKINIWGIGPYVDANIRALLWCGFYLQGKAGVWTTYTRASKYRIATNYPEIPGAFAGFRDVETQDRFAWTVRLFYEGGVALGWGTYFCDCSYHVDFLVGYDMVSDYFAVYQLSVGNTFKPFYIQGLSVRAQLDF